MKGKLGSLSLFSAVVLRVNNAIFYILLAVRTVNSSMIGMLLNVVHGEVQKSKQKHITKESSGFHNQSPLITMSSCRFLSLALVLKNELENARVRRGRVILLPFVFFSSPFLILRLLTVRATITKSYVQRRH